MRVPERLEPLVDQGVIHEVVRPLMAGKEAQVYLVRVDGQARVAKVYKEATDRSFRQRVMYTEGRKVRNSRQQRAMDKGSRYGREQIEEAWRSAEVDAIYRLRAAGVRVPEPYDFVDGVLVMELVADSEGEPAPRLADLQLERREARRLFDLLLREVVKMLCAGLVHGDLSDFNVLVGARGPVIIDFPQAVDSAHNNVARKLLIRDVDNLVSFLARHAPELRGRQYGKEMWALYETNQLHPDTVLTGRAPDRRAPHKNDLLALLDDLSDRTRRQREETGEIRPARAPRFHVEPEPGAPGRGRKGPKGPPQAQPKAPPPQARTPSKPQPPKAARPPQRPPPDAGEDLPDDLDALLILGDG